MIIPEKLDLVSASAEASKMDAYLKQTGTSHKNYKSYTTYPRLAPKIAEDAIYLSTGEHWNDIQDRESFNQEFSPTVNYGMCFSYSSQENVAMWMLYGGMENNGVMVDFTDTMIKQILRAKYVELGEWHGEWFHCMKSLGKEDYEIKMMDVLYVEHLEKTEEFHKVLRGKEKATIKRAILEDLPFIRKAYPWSYEKECRLVLSVKSQSSGGYTSARIVIPGIYQSLSDKGRIYMSPNAKGLDDVREVKLQPSTLNGPIDWNLCYGCVGAELKENNREELAHV